MRCPICRKAVDDHSAIAPFCSERCRLIDLGNWAAEKYAIPGSPAADEEPEDIEAP